MLRFEKTSTDAANRRGEGYVLFRKMASTTIIIANIISVSSDTSLNVFILIVLAAPPRPDPLVDEEVDQILLFESVITIQFPCLYLDPWPADNRRALMSQ